jgi:hypothetical protein
MYERLRARALEPGSGYGAETERPLVPRVTGAP